MDLNEIGLNAKKAFNTMTELCTIQKNKILKTCSKKLILDMDNILDANKIDILNAEKIGLKPSFIDRLMLNEERIKDIAYGLLKIEKLPDPIGEYFEGKTLENGLKVIKKRVAIGVIGIIYEARPNVTSDAFGLCLKAGSSVILRGGKEAINSNKAIVSCFRSAIKELGYDENIIQLIEDISRETSFKMMKLKEYIDLLIPRGGASLIKTVVENSTIPIIETGTGNCHVFVDEFADFKKAIPIIINSKVQRPSVCNSAETLLVHKNIAIDFLPKIFDKLKQNNVKIRCDEKTMNILNDEDLTIATEQDWFEEFGDYVLAIKVVDTIEEAISHISKYSTSHSDCIVTENYFNASTFIEKVDSAVVYVNSSTRFTDGNEFGFGAEIGISTQKLHARGPMGLKEITSYKYVVFGNGQIRG